jgi:hypothetical protein
MSNTRTILLGDVLFSFDSHEDAEENFNLRLAACGVPKGQRVAIDSAGRLMTNLEHTDRARAEGTYPVTIYDINVTSNPEGGS